MRAGELFPVSRAIQGIGGALLLTSSLAILSHAFIGAARQHALAFWGASLGIALAAGPIIGGAITDFFGWRWVFLVNLPICVVLVVSTFRVIEESHDPDARSLDWAGIATFSLALAVMIWALIDGNDAGWTSQTIAVRLVVAAILFAAFAVAELRQKHPMVDFGLFRHRTFLGGVLAMIGYGASAQVMVFFLPVFLQNAYGFSPFAAGVAMIPFAMPMVLALKFVPPLASRYSGRILLSAGLATTLVGNVLFWYVASAGRSYAYFVVSMVIAGIGAGLLNGQTVKVLQGAVPEERAGMASGIASTTRFIGILVAVAALGAVLGNVARDAFSAAAIAFGLGPEAAATGAKGVISGDLEGVVRTVPNAIRTQIHDAGLHAYAHGFAAATVIAAAVAAIAAVVTFLTVSERETAPSANQAQQLVGD